MNVSSISSSRRNLFIQYANSFMSVPNEEQGKIIENPVNPEDDKSNKPKGIETLTTFTIFPKQVVNGHTVITA